MGQIVVTEFVSLDGVMDSPGGGDFEHAGWTFEFNRGEAGDMFKFREIMEAEAQLLGRVTYEAFAGAWPKMEGTGEFGERMNSMPKYVLSSTLQQADWNNTTILRGDPADVIPGLKQEVEGIILVAGSAQLVQALVEADLVDELRLMVFPIILGQGKRLFGPTATKKAMQLTAQETVGDGVEILTYRPR